MANQEFLVGEAAEITSNVLKEVGVSSDVSEATKSGLMRGFEKQALRVGSKKVASKVAAKTGKKTAGKVAGKVAGKIVAKYAGSAVGIGEAMMIADATPFVYRGLKESGKRLVSGAKETFSQAKKRSFRKAARAAASSGAGAFYESQKGATLGVVAALTSREVAELGYSKEKREEIQRAREERAEKKKKKKEEKKAKTNPRNFSQYVSMRSGPQHQMTGEVHFLSRLSRDNLESDMDELSDFELKYRRAKKNGLI